MSTQEATTRTTIARQTFLGRCYEELAAEAVGRIDPAFERSPQPPDGLISPDFLRLGTAPAFVAVTATPTRNTFQKKKWRYVHEVFAAKQYHRQAAPLVGINILFPPEEAIQPLDRRILQFLFDGEIVASRLPGLDGLAEELLHQDDGRAPATVATRRLLASASFPTFAEALDRRIEALAADPAAAAKNQALWAVVRSHASRETLRTSVPVVDESRRSYLRLTCFGLLLYPDDQLPTVLEKCRRNRGLTEAAPFRATGMDVTPRINGEWTLASGKVTRTLHAGFSVSDVLEVCRSLQTSAELQHILADLADHGRPAAWVSRLSRLFRSSRRDEFIHLVCTEFAAARDRRNPRRLESLDYALLLGGTSITDMDKELAHRHGDLGAANRVQCMIAARCQGRFSFRDEDTRKVAARVWDILLSETDVATITPPRGLQRVVRKRQEALVGLGGEANPAELLFQRTCARAGLRWELVSLPCLWSDVGLRGRGVSVERLYRVTDGDAVAHVKALSGYTGGLEHKAEELAGRGWILRYRRAGGSYSRDPMRLVFVYEGEWDQAAITMMARAGWDEAVALIDLMRMDPASVASALFG
jgi:hypothetical protein